MTTVRLHDVEGFIEIKNEQRVCKHMLISSRQKQLATSVQLLDVMACGEKGLIERYTCGGLLCPQDDIPVTCRL